MKAFFITAPGQTSFGQIAEPSPRPDEVLLRPRVLGFCGSDLNTYRGRNPLVQYPRIPGHEVGAVIEAVGTEVPDSLQPGMAVTVSPYSNCGSCSACRQRRPNACRNNQTLGVQRDGALTELLAVPWDRVLRAESLSLAEYALVEPLTIGFHAAARGRVGSADTVVVLGCGAVGLGAVSGAAARGARVVAVDLDEAKLELARAAGAAHTVNTAGQELHEALSELTNGDGPEVVIEAIGLPATFRAAVDEVCFAGRVVYIGYAKEQVGYETKQFILKELDILGSRNALRQDFEAVIALLETKRFPVDGVISRTVPFAEAGEALRAWDAAPSDVTRIHVVLP